MADYDVIVIGSGFGGSVTALRLSERGYRVAVIEGYYLRELLDDIESQRTNTVQEFDSRDAAALKKQYQTAQIKRPIVTRLKVFPTLKTRLVDTLGDELGQRVMEGNYDD